MGIKSIKVKNLLSFDELNIENIRDINCIIGRNNVGKSNLLKLIRFFYNILDGKRELPPVLNNNYSSFGSITIEYDLTGLSKIVNAKKNNKIKYFKYIASILLPIDSTKNNFTENYNISREYSYRLTLTIHSNNVIEWCSKNKEARRLISDLFPLFEIEARHIDLYDWDKLWHLVSRLKTFKVENIDHEEIVDFLDGKISENDSSYSDYISKITKITKTSNYTYRERVLNYIKVGLKGQTFTIDGKALITQSDGTNAHRYIELFLELVISLTRRSYISPIVYIDEPEIGLHPKKNEQLISTIYDTYMLFKKNKPEYELGRYKTPYPQIIMATHSPNIVKMIIKLFKNDQQVLHFSKDKNTKVTKMNSIYNDSRFLNIFGDNEARLFFSEKILFVEGATELELFSNNKLHNEYNHIKVWDIYATNEFVLKYINPSYANMAIPFLVLYDADKLLSFNFNNNKIILKTSSINIDEIRKKYKYAIYKSPYFNLEKNINKLKNKLENKNIKYDDLKLKIENEDYQKLVLEINKIVLNENYWIISTTTEGLLINRSSIKLFKKWLKHEIRNGLNVRQNGGDIKEKIKSEKEKFLESKDLLATCTNLLSYCSHEPHLEKEQKYFILNLKRKLIHHIFFQLQTNFPNREDQLIVLRLIFCGKSDTLLGRKDKDFIKIINNEDFIRKLKSLRTEYMISISYLFDKTSGWITKFMDYSIDWVNKNKEDKTFYDEFKLLFPELHSIIEQLQLR